MMRAVCYCDSCQEAAKRLGERPGAPDIVRKTGGTDFVLYRKDRIGEVVGGEHLQEHRLTPRSPTRRLVAGCCNTPMLLDFTKGFWVNFYRGTLSATAVGKKKPKLRAHTPLFMLRLFLAWAAMGFRRPRLPQALAPDF